MKDIVHTPCDQDVKSVRRVSDLLKDGIGAEMFGHELLGWSVSAKVV